MASVETGGQAGGKFSARDQAWFKEGDEAAMRDELSGKWLGALDSVMARKAAQAGGRQAALRDGLVASQRDVTRAAMELIASRRHHQPEDLQRALEDAIDARADRILQELADQASPEALRQAA